MRYRKLITAYFTPDMLDTAIHAAASTHSQTFYQEVRNKRPFVRRKVWQAFEEKRLRAILNKYTNINVPQLRKDVHAYVNELMGFED